METRSAVVDVLGGSEVMGAMEDRVGVRTAVRSGLPYSAFENVTSALSMSQKDLARALSIQPRTLSRRRTEGRFQATESDRLYRVARVLAHARAVLGTMPLAAQWMTRPNRALGGEEPIYLLDTDIGVQEVDDALGRIEHGIFG
ncbi:MAG: antitoxin Xre/MbcA/ParS toxin-binding domain-containing protein [Acidobacteriota bacterium]